jgi:hypothetical protein
MFWFMSAKLKEFYRAEFVQEMRASEAAGGVMQLRWVPETDNSFILRDSKGCARAVIKHRDKAWGFVGHLLEPGFPSAGPYKSHRRVAAFLNIILKRDFLPGADIDPIPDVRYEPKRKRV